MLCVYHDASLPGDQHDLRNAEVLLQRGPGPQRQAGRQQPAGL